MRSWKVALGPVRGAGAVWGLLGLAALALLPEARGREAGATASPHRIECSNGAVRLDTDFAGGAAASCAVVGDAELRLAIAPEDAPPINCSPWYAFRLTPQANSKRGKRVTITLDYTACGHRYWPKTSNDGVNWSALPASQVRLFEEKGVKKAQLSIKLARKPLFIASQEIIAPATYDQWLAEKARHPDAQRTRLGLSAEGRSIDMVTISNAAGAGGEQVVLLGRQHPPEISGALAMFFFVDTILSDDPVARAYRERFTTIVIPALNPDGVARGHWRHATGGRDLNRDWGPFTQPETRLMQGLLAAIAADPKRQLRLFLDFHSTHKDVVYTLPDSSSTEPPHFTSAWMRRYQERMPGYEVERDPGHNAGLPTSKSWVYETYRVPTATFELGDDTDRRTVARVGKQAALAMMETMLGTPRP